MIQRHFINIETMTDPHHLLRAYATTGSEDSFRELVTRYLGLVYSTALRQVGGDTHLAEDVSQTVFADLATQAGSLSADVMLGGWLYQRTVNVTRTLMRSERRRSVREKEVVEMSLSQEHTAANLARVGPALDEAITRLDEEDRLAITLRFFEHRDLRSVGQALGINQDAAQKRVSRALDKMRAVLERNGVAVSACAIGAALAAEQTTAMPIGLAAGITANALSKTTAVAVRITAETLTMTSLSKAAVTAVLVVAVAVAVQEARQASRDRSALLELEQEQTQKDEQLAQVVRERDASKLQLASLRDEQAKSKDKEAELLRLRGEVTRLKRKEESPGREPQVQTAASGAIMRLPVISGESLVNVHKVVSWDEVLVTPGWKSTPSSTNRLFIFAVPKQGSGAGELTIQTHILELPEDQVTRYGLQDIHPSAGTENLSSATLTKSQFETLVKTARQDGSVRFLGSPSITTLSGKETQLRNSDIRKTPSGDAFDAGQIINILPTISADGGSVDFTMIAHPDYLLPLVDVNH